MLRDSWTLVQWVNRKFGGLDQWVKSGVSRRARLIHISDQKIRDKISDKLSFVRCRETEGRMPDARFRYMSCSEMAGTYISRDLRASLCVLFVSYFGTSFVIRDSDTTFTTERDVTQRRQASFAAIPALNVR